MRAGVETIRVGRDRARDRGNDGAVGDDAPRDEGARRNEGRRLSPQDEGMRRRGGGARSDGASPVDRSNNRRRRGARVSRTRRGADRERRRPLLRSQAERTRPIFARRGSANIAVSSFECEPKADPAELGEIPPGEAVDRLNSTVPEGLGMWVRRRPRQRDRARIAAQRRSQTKTGCLGPTEASCRKRRRVRVRVT